MLNKSMKLAAPMNFLLALFMTVGLSVSASAIAQQAKPCAEDAKKFCQGVEKGEGRIAQCMKQHELELSPACKEKIAVVKVKAKDFAQACKADMQKNCKEIKPGEGRILQCLKQHEATLSPECREKMSQPRGKQR